MVASSPAFPHLKGWCQNLHLTLDKSGDLLKQNSETQIPPRENIILAGEKMIDTVWALLHNGRYPWGDPRRFRPAATASLALMQIYLGPEQGCLSQGLDWRGCQHHIAGCSMGLLLLSKNCPKQLELIALPSRDSGQKLEPDILPN